MDPLYRNRRKTISTYKLPRRRRRSKPPWHKNRASRAEVGVEALDGTRAGATLGEVRRGESGASLHGATLRPSAPDGRDMVTFDVEVRERSRMMPSLKPKQATSHPSHQWAARQSSLSGCSPPSGIWPRDMFQKLCVDLCSCCFKACASSMDHGEPRELRGGLRMLCCELP
jgi:hypothetical protein